MELVDSRLEAITEKYKKIGRMNAELLQAQIRKSSLGLKMAVIEVGGESDLSRECLQDSVVDAIRAAESAYNNGYILGGNITTIRCIDELIEEDLSEIDRLILNVLR